MQSTARPLRVVFLDRATISPRTTLKELPFPHELQRFDRTSAQEVSSRIRLADIVITNKVRLSASDIAAAENLQMVAIAATGSDHIDLHACQARGIVVSNIRNYAVRTVPEHTFALIFALRRSLAAYRDAVRAGRWLESGQFCFFDYPIRDLKGATLGIIGDGVLGRAVAEIGSALGMRVLFSAYKDRANMGTLYTPFDDLLVQADVITLHCPLTPATRDLIAAPEFARIKEAGRKPLIVNTSRGGLVDETALVAALKAGDIAGAGFDVVTQEPLPAEHPFNEVLGHPAFILTPHVAWASDEAIQCLTDQLVDNISAFVDGQPVNVVTPK
ncbi:D-2-hydroxyacid dehydrogenase [Trinickia dinghuensis]|uniref:D-2-hydroxyacid dehydrogenase n=1 Tax=Trinickia dinghuensis TaxID=2291023 RepID=A0A3D8JX64_9BURK|nr:D-2-hydroxyacid dehydrogenase [Trinickia dinghuensis]RDU97708.1 D-2-hydroxyacid dehydrogenase [Trinickia dinghuensis]